MTTAQRGLLLLIDRHGCILPRGGEWATARALIRRHLAYCDTWSMHWLTPAGEKLASEIRKQRKAKR